MIRSLKLYIGGVFVTVLLTVTSIASSSSDALPQQTDALQSRFIEVSSEVSTDVGIDQSFALNLTTSESSQPVLSMSVQSAPAWVSIGDCSEVDLQLQCILEGTSPTTPGDYDIELEVITADGKRQLATIILSII